MAVVDPTAQTSYSSSKCVILSMAAVYPTHQTSWSSCSLIRDDAGVLPSTLGCSKLAIILSADEIAAILEEQVGLLEAEIYITLPDNPLLSDEDSGDEEETNFDHLSGNQLKAVSESRITKVFSGEIRTEEVHSDVILPPLSSSSQCSGEGGTTLSTLGRDSSLNLPITSKLYKMSLTFILYMYLDHVELKNAEDARYLYKASVSYAIPHLCEISAGYMAKDLNFDNIWQVLELVAEIQEPFLKEECGKFVRRNPQLVLSHVNFSKLSKGVVANIVELDCLDVPEIEIILAVDRWAESQCTQFDMNVNRVNKREFIGPDILEKLRFLAVPQDAFVKELAFTPDNEKCLLTLEESYAILMNLTQVGSFPIPTEFSSDKRARKLAKFRCIRKIQQLPPHMMGGYTHSSQMYAASYASAMERVVALASPTQSATLGGKNFSLDVKVDHPIILYGIQVPTLCFPVGIGPKNLTKEYDESFVVTVQDPAGTPINQTVLSTKVPYGSSVDIILKDSVVLQRNVTYKIQVYTSNNYFLSKKLSLMEENPPVKFSFRDAAKVGNIPPPPSSSMYATGGTGLKQETDLGFITQVIYSLWI
uniref:BACK domain-containing protein n=1 Tax=Timema shepardi TaxID=629360 RepID=A0A7R9B0V1_TIMSH|nr:unnamed protein product [Timema shepardi]